MPDLDFRVTGVEAAAHGMSPLLRFRLEVENRAGEEEQIQGATVQAQIQFQCPQRAYSAAEKEKLVELFGTPDRWGQTLRNRLWTIAMTTLPAFRGRAEAVLPVPCTFDLNIGAAKFLHALEDGDDVPLLFLFSGTVLYSAPDGRLQAQRISHEKECTWRMPVAEWRALMEQHWPNAAWMVLRRDVFEKVSSFKRRNGFATWEETMERLLESAEVEALLQP